MLMINIREYCFGTLTYMGVNDNDITKYLETFQENVLKSNDNSLEEKAYSSPFSQVIFDLYQGNICETNKEYITVPDTMKCEDILYNSSKYGFNILLSTYFTQLRAIKNQMDYLYLFGTQNNFTYNMTLFGTKYADDKLPSDPALMNKYFQLHPMIVFNSEPFLSVLYAYRYSSCKYRAALCRQWGKRACYRSVSSARRHRAHHLKRYCFKKEADNTCHDECFTGGIK